MVDTALAIQEIIERKKVINWQNNIDIQKQMGLEVGDYILDEVQTVVGIQVFLDEVDRIAEEMISVAINRS